jgi:hypothetical protein
MAKRKHVAARRNRRWVRGSLKILSCAFVIVLLIGGLIVASSINGADADRLQAFVNAVNRWQSNPDFRRVESEYVTLSHEALQTRPFGVSPTRIIMGLRSLPGVPEDIRVNPDSERHYIDFTSGRLTAYLKLCSEQGVKMVVDSLNEMGRTPDLTDERILEFLNAFKLDWPVAHDAGAIASVRRLLADTDAARPYEVQETVEKSLQSHVDAITASLNWPQDIYRLTSEQQDYVLDHLDDQVKRTEPELWRTKQISDFLSGIWGQAYGHVYASVIRAVLTAHFVAECFTPVLALLIIVAGLQLRARARRVLVVAAPKLAHAGPPFF